jgi:hypothetical protein
MDDGRQVLRQRDLRGRVVTDADRLNAIFHRLGKIDRDLIVQGIA